MGARVRAATCRASTGPRPSGSSTPPDGRRSATASGSARGVAGVPDGTRLAIEFLHFPAFAKYGELMRQQLGAVGIDVTLRPLEPAVFAPTVFKDRAFDTNVISYCNGPDPEVGVRRMYHSSQIGPAPFTNAAGYRNERVDALFDQASRTVERAAERALPPDPGDRGAGPAVRLAGGDADDAGLGGAVRGLQGMDGAVRRGRVLQEVAAR